jgi:hypothetical protein
VRIREATRADVPCVVALLADDDLGRRRESVEVPLDEPYWAALMPSTLTPATSWWCLRRTTVRWPAVCS